MSWQNGMHGAENGTYGANAANEAVGAYDGHGVHPDPAGHTQSPNVYHPQADTGLTPEYDEYADPAAAHGWQNAYDETAELPTMSAIGAGAGAGAEVEVGATGAAVGGVAAGHRRKKSASSRRGVVVGAVAGAVSVVSVAALIVGFGGSDTPSGGGPGGEGKRARSTAGASVTPAEDPAAADSPDPAGAGPSDAALTSPGGARGASGSSTSPTTLSGAGPANSASPSDASSPTVTATGDSAPGNSGSNPGRGKDGTKGPK